MIRTICTLVVLFASAPVGALDLAGFELGQELTMMNRADMTRSEGGFCTETSCRGPKMLGDYAVTVFVQANPAGRIQLITVSMPAERKAALLAAAIEKFGKPSKVVTGEVQNRFGARFSQATAAWSMKDGSVVFFERCNAVSESCIAAISNDFVHPDAGKKLKL